METHINETTTVTCIRPIVSRMFFSKSLRSSLAVLPTERVVQPETNLRVCANIYHVEDDIIETYPETVEVLSVTFAFRGEHGRE